MERGQDVDFTGCLRGAVTVYCSLVLLLMAALLGSLLESARQTGLRARMTQTVQTGLDSLFSMYDEGLYEQYGLLFLNEDLLEQEPADALAAFLAPAAGAAAGQKTPQLLSFDITDVQLDEVYYAADDEGIFLEREVLELMKYQEAAQLLGQLKTFLEQITNAGQAYAYVVEQNDAYEQTDWEALAGEAGKDADTGGEAEESGASGGMQTPDISNEDIDAALDGSIITQVQELLTDTLLALFVQDVSALSDKSAGMEAAFGVSHGISGQNAFWEDMENAVLYDEYLMSYMGSFLHPSGAAGLDYEVEYIIGGARTDKENLLAVLTKLLLARMGLNIVFLLANHSYYEQAELLAGTLVGWTGLAALVAAVKLLLIAVWAFAESVLDVRALLLGKKVAFFKNAESWTSGITDCVARVAAGEAAKQSGGGVDYEMYLRIFLLGQGMTEKCLRTMCVIEWNLRGQAGREDFSFSRCIYGAEITVLCSAHPVFSGMYAGVYSGKQSGEYQVQWSQTY